MRRLALALAAALLPVAAAAAPLVPDPAWHPAVLHVPLPDRGIRALLIHPDEPRAALVTLPGGAARSASRPTAGSTAPTTWRSALRRCGSPAATRC